MTEAAWGIGARGRLESRETGWEVIRKRLIPSHVLWRGFDWASGFVLGRRSLVSVDCRRGVVRQATAFSLRSHSVQQQSMATIAVF